LAGTDEVGGRRHLGGPVGVGGIDRPDLGDGPAPVVAPTGPGVLAADVVGRLLDRLLVAVVDRPAAWTAADEAEEVVLGLGQRRGPGVVLGPGDAEEEARADARACLGVDELRTHSHQVGMGSEFVDAEARTGVSARFLFGITWTENNAGASTLAQTQHNLFSFVGSGPGGWAVYDSNQQSIQEAADYIGSQYARPGGSHYRGGTIAEIGTVYAADPNWAAKVATAANFIGPSK